MPLNVPSAAVTAADVWSYATRKLTSLADPADIVKFVGKGTGEEVPANHSLYDMIVPFLEKGGTQVPTGKSLYDLIALDRIDYQRIEVAQVPATQNAVAVLNTTSETTLGSKNITVSIPTGATIISVIALARINIMNDSASAQKIDLKMKVAGVTLFNQSDVVGFPAADGASSVYTIAEDASDEVTAVGQVVTLEALATLSAAASVRLQAQYFLFITYRMGS